MTVLNYCQQKTYGRIAGSSVGYLCVKIEPIFQGYSLAH
jgi:hypothetical protein